MKQESEDGTEITLEVKVGKYMDTSLIKADVQPHFIRLLIKGKLLQLELGVEVRCGQYSTCTLPSPPPWIAMGAAR
jgi:protein TilB